MISILRERGGFCFPLDFSRGFCYADIAKSNQDDLAFVLKKGGKEMNGTSTGVSRVLAYEIVGNPNDVVITYSGPDKKTGKFAGWITRGEGHNFKPLLNTEPIYDTPKQAKKAMKELVKAIKKFVEKDLKDPDNPLKEFLAKPAP